MRAPKVSVLMPVFNAERFLPRAVESVLSQSFEHFELVMVDDGSTDGSLALMRSYADRRVRVIENGRNLGISAARNRAVGGSEGEYLAWLDSDDAARPERLAVQASILDHRPDVGLCHSNFEEIDDQDRVSRTAWNASDFLPTEWLILWTNPIAQSTVMVRRSILGTATPYNPEHDPAEDYDLWTRLTLATRMAYVPEVLASYRTLPTSAFHTRAKRALTKSAESNERLVRSLVDRPVPEFHRFLTSFGGAMEGDIPDVGLDEVWEWYRLLSRAVDERCQWDSPIRARIQDDIQQRLEGLLLEKSRILFSLGTRRMLLRENPAMFLRLAARTLCRRARAAAATLLRRFRGFAAAL